MKYDVTFACGHSETRELFGKSSDRESKLRWFSERCVCSACYKAEQAVKTAAEYSEVEILYKEYKSGAYASCKTKPGSYDADKKTIVVYIKKEA